MQCFSHTQTLRHAQDLAAAFCTAARCCCVAYCGCQLLPERQPQSGPVANGRSQTPQQVTGPRLQPRAPREPLFPSEPGSQREPAPESEPCRTRAPEPKSEPSQRREPKKASVERTVASDQGERRARRTSGVAELSTRAARNVLRGTRRLDDRQVSPIAMTVALDEKTSGTTGRDQPHK